MGTCLLSPEALAHSLSSVRSAEVVSAWLMTPEGQIMGFSEDLSLNRAALKSALLASLWRAETSAAQLARHEGVELGPLEYVLIENESGFYGMATCGNFIVALEATDQAQLGMLKKKTLVLAEALATPLSSAVPPHWNSGSTPSQEPDNSLVPFNCEEDETQAQDQTVPDKDNARV
eukprot:maker-scaffold156_size297567-snap-gene-1.30 protein:Tk07672 transcript:maker-scaffold156_size297567-snap-gene-1.30-mRNA-1 annotation:"GH19709"